MKLVRYGERDHEKPGLIDATGAIRDLSGEVEDIAASALSPQALKRLAALDASALPLVSGKPRLGPCVGKVSKLLAIGLNYADHAREAGIAPPAEPVLFMKAVSAICGPNDDTIRPRDSNRLDHEVELGVVIGTRASYVEESRALDYVAGYCLANDISERGFQLERGGGQWDKGKGCDTFAPLGPWLVTRDEIADPQNLSLYLDVNGERRQTGNTANMIFPVAHIVAYLSCFLTLMPGDVILTGTPPGVGLGMKPPRFLNPGDEVRLGIAGLGEQHQRIIAWPG
ncbi:MAG: fumarylacetoacetate hydrolase family protein [Rhodobiaceae bacterium]|nr:fumarylacetoacetate hydrolase family protein [Rhodobiaceae bacterium]